MPAAINFPAADSLARDALLSFARLDEPVIFASNGRYHVESAFAAAKALAWGYKKVYYFAGGYPAWEEASYPVEVSARN